MTRHRAVLPAAVLALALAFPAAPAHAASPAHGGPGDLLVYPLAGLGIAGVIFDVVDAAGLATTGHVSRFVSEGGTAVWILAALLTVPYTVGILEDPGAATGDRILAVSAPVLVAGSLALSIYSVTRGPPVAVAPTAFRGPRGARIPGVVLSLRW